MKKLLLLNVGIVSLISLFSCQNSATPPINRGGEIVYEKDGHGLVVAPTDLGIMDWDSAMTACDTLILNGYSDWRLPSKEELNQLYLKKDTIGGFTLNFYWSSTEDKVGIYGVWGQYFSVGIQQPTYEDEKCNVRAVRSF